VLCGGCHRNLHRGYLRIVGSRDEGLVFLDREGRDLGRQARLLRGLWLDVKLGWQGEEWNSTIIGRWNVRAEAWLVESAQRVQDDHVENHGYP